MMLAPLLKQHGMGLSGLSAIQHNALYAIVGCRSNQYGHMRTQCTDCTQTEHRPHSCGHRNCPQCLHHCTSLWLDRQMTKLLPCTYFMVTFTLPAELRPVARRYPAVVYNAIMDCAASTLKTFAGNDRRIGSRIGMTAILHTHSRSKEYHPHVHVVMPNGGVTENRRQWQTKPGKYLFNGRTLATVFRARVLDQLAQQGHRLTNVPTKWVVHCKRVGSGLPALKYLSRYLYRGVMPEKDILYERDGCITFQYWDNQRHRQTRTVPVDRFIRLVLQHVLPKGFRRVREYGFLNGNARTTLKKVQWALQVVIPKQPERPRPDWRCPHCGGVMKIISTKRKRVDDG